MKTKKIKDIKIVSSSDEDNVSEEILSLQNDGYEMYGYLITSGDTYGVKYTQMMVKY